MLLHMAMLLGVLSRGGVILPDDSPAAGPPGMVWIPGGTFTMGSEPGPGVRPDESPPHRVRVKGFWIDRTEVTNRQFAEFVKATGYVTIAERPVDWEELRKQVPEGTPKPAEEMLAPGALVFTMPTAGTRLDNPAGWWRWTPGASWRHPEGPDSSIDDRLDHPVVQVAWLDAVAYAAWAGKRLPTEAEWEFAARGGLDRRAFTWGDEPIDPKRANTWQGDFPVRNDLSDGFARTAPVGRFPPNGYGLVDMAGNVWEWCDDRFDSSIYPRRVAEALRASVPEGEPAVTDPHGPDFARDPRNPEARDSRVQKGGSFLCHASYCSSYRPSARMGCTPDTGMSHLGFRCVRDEAAPAPPGPVQPGPEQTRPGSPGPR
jgi:formylglycine-generating enzyme required for sulfatase activity